MPRVRASDQLIRESTDLIAKSFGRQSVRISNTNYYHCDLLGNLLGSLDHLLFAGHLSRITKLSYDLNTDGSLVYYTLVYAMLQANSEAHYKLAKEKLLGSVVVAYRVMPPIVRLFLQRSECLYTYIMCPCRDHCNEALVPA